MHATRLQILWQAVEGGAAERHLVDELGDAPSGLPRTVVHASVPIRECSRIGTGVDARGGNDSSDTNSANRYCSPMSNLLDGVGRDRLGRQIKHDSHKLRDGCGSQRESPRDLGMQNLG